MTEVENFEIGTARVGQTVRHIPSGLHYIVTRAHGSVNGHPPFVAIKSPRGQIGFVGDDYIDPKDFVALKF